MILSFVAYFYTGNPCIVLFLQFSLRPLVWLLNIGDSHNLDKVNEKNFMSSWAFRLPLYLYILTQHLIWVWMIVLWGDGYKPNHWIFHIDIGGWDKCIFFHIVLLHHGSVSLAAGHELFHSKNKIDQCIGLLPFYTGFWGHFYDVHIKIHHKSVGTPEDYASAPLGQSMWTTYAKV
jgi:hypothetical protein